ncbi:MAG: PKD domain-containing protein [Thermoplasmata archaeon]|nr:MAG: PKD domain-containing protein [Thermoplasmata archaeon]
MTISIVIEVSERSSSIHIFTVDAGEDQTVNEGDVVQFNGSADSDTFIPVWPVDISDNGAYMAVGWDKNVSFFSTASNVPIWTYYTGGRVGDLKLNSDGGRLVIGSYQTVIYYDTIFNTKLWSVNIGDSFIRFDSDPGNRLDMSKNGRYVGAAATGKRVKVYDAWSATPTVPYWDFYFNDFVNIVRFSDDGKYLGMGGHSGQEYRLGWIPDKSINWTKSTPGSWFSSSLSYNGSKISTGQSGAQTIKLFGPSSNTPIWECPHNGRKFEQAMSDDGNYFVTTNHKDLPTGDWDGFTFWNTSRASPIWTYIAGNTTDAVDIDNDANYVVGGSRDKNVYLFSKLGDGSPDWNLSDGTPIFTYSTDGIINYNGVSISGDGTLFAAGSWDGNVYLFSTVGGPHLVWNFSTSQYFSKSLPYIYRWDFNNFEDSDGDGGFTNDVDATGPTPTHVFGDDGVYTVTLTAEDSCGCIAVDTVTVTVNNIPPEIEPFGPFIMEEYSPLFLSGNATDPGSDDLTFTWNWSDGTGDNVIIYYNNDSIPDPYPSPDINPMDITDSVNHTYFNYGIYNVTLTVEDDDGGISQYTTNVTIIEVLKGPPTLYINVSPDQRDIILNWDPPPNTDVNHYLIYRSTSQTGFNFNSIWVNTSKDNETGEPDPIHLRTMWNDTNAAVPDDPNYKKQYYYTIKAVDKLGVIRTNSRTVGKFTKIFQEGVSTFSLPLESIDDLFTDNLTSSMNADYIKYMDNTTHNWVKHNFGDNNINNTQMKLGEGYEVKFSSQFNYTFTGLPATMISCEDSGFLGFDPSTDAKNLTIQVEPNGDVNLTWQEPSSMGAGDWYEIYYSNERDGFFKTYDKDYCLICPKVYFGNNTANHTGAQAKNPGVRLYYMVVPFNKSGIRGTSTYSIGIWTEEYYSGYDTFGIPFLMSSNHTADWYCDNIPDTVGINYFNNSKQRWYWHSKEMSEGAFDPTLVMTVGYQISTAADTKYTFVGH